MVREVAGVEPGLPPFIFELGFGGRAGVREDGWYVSPRFPVLFTFAWSGCLV